MNKNKSSTETVKKALSETTRAISKKSNLNVNFEIDQSLVRGLDYYSHTTFEFKSKQIGTQTASPKKLETINI